MKNDFSPKSLILVALVLSSASCTSVDRHPGQVWSWAAMAYVDTPETKWQKRGEWERRMRENFIRADRIAKENPDWEKAVSDDVLIIECSKDGRVCTAR